MTNFVFFSFQGFHRLHSILCWEPHRLLSLTVAGGAAPNSYAGSDRRASRPAICRVAPTPQKSIRADTPTTQSDGLTPCGGPSSLTARRSGSPRQKINTSAFVYTNRITGWRSNPTVGVRHYGTARRKRDRSPKGNCLGGVLGRFRPSSASGSTARAGSWSPAFFFRRTAFNPS